MLNTVYCAVLVYVCVFVGVKWKKAKVKAEFTELLNDQNTVAWYNILVYNLVNSSSLLYQAVC